MCLRQGQGGFTLIEVVMSIIIISIALVGVYLVMNTTTAASADPMLRHQALAVAESYLEEILLKPFADPDGTDGETLRSDFDDVDDYHNLNDDGARDQDNNLIAGLEKYTVQISVTAEDLGGSGLGNTLRIDVTVVHPAAGSLTLSGYRSRF